MESTLAVGTDKVLDLMTARVYRIRGIFANLDSPHFDYSRAQIVYEPTLQVRDDDGRTLGYATVTRKGDLFEAEVAFDYSTPERLELEIGSEKLYLVPDAEVKAGEKYRYGLWSGLGAKETIWWVYIFALVIRRVPVDPRLPPIEVLC